MELQKDLKKFLDLLLSKKVEGNLSGVSAFYISKPDLIRNKRSTGRSKDIVDAEILEKRSES